MTDWDLNRPILVAAVAAAAAEFSHRLSYWLARPDAPGLERPVLEALAAHDASKELVACLCSDDPFSGGSGFFIAVPNGYVGFHATDAATALIRLVAQGSTPEVALEWLTRLLRTTSARGMGVMALWGIDCRQAIELAPDVRLVPIADLPDSAAKAWILRPQDPRSMRVGVSALWKPPTVALMTPHTITPVVYRADAAGPPQQEDPFRLHILLDDVRLALTVCGPSHPLPAGHWFEFDDPDLQATFHSGGISRQHIEVLPMGFAPPHQVDAAQAKRVVTAFLSMPTEARPTVRLALSRFNQAVRRPPHGDRALDLAISLESLLVDNAGENTYKFGLRAALLLGGSLEQRMNTRALVSALYTLRSSLVHDGVLPSTVKMQGAGKRPSVEVVNEATVVGSRILERILEMGCIPDWYRYELHP